MPQEHFEQPAYYVSAYEHPKWPILKQGETETFRPAAWGLIPSWIKDTDAASSIRDKTINARLESIDSKPSFRSLVDSRRCGVLLDSFVEWRSFNGKKYPYRIGLPENRPFLIAGLWDRWHVSESDSMIETFTVITVEAQGIPAQVHNTKLRMPLILSRTVGQAWLDLDRSFTACKDSITPLFRPLEAWPISRDISVRGKDKNVPGILDRFEYPELPALEPVQ